MPNVRAKPTVEADAGWPRKGDSLAWRQSSCRTPGLSRYLDPGCLCHRDKLTSLRMHCGASEPLATLGSKRPSGDHSSLGSLDAADDRHRQFTQHDGDARWQGKHGECARAVQGRPDELIGNQSIGSEQRRVRIPRRSDDLRISHLTGEDSQAVAAGASGTADEAAGKAMSFEPSEPGRGRFRLGVGRDRSGLQADLGGLRLGNQDVPVKQPSGSRLGLKANLRVQGRGCLQAHRDRAAQVPSDSAADITPVARVGWASEP